jgi:hypothetical protein
VRTAGSATLGNKTSGKQVNWSGKGKSKHPIQSSVGGRCWIDRGSPAGGEHGLHRDRYLVLRESARSDQLHVARGQAELLTPRKRKSPRIRARGKCYDAIAFNGRLAPPCLSWTQGMETRSVFRWGRTNAKNRPDKLTTYLVPVLFSTNACLAYQGTIRAILAGFRRVDEDEQPTVRE